MKLTPELAEAIWIHTGDGYLRYIGARKELDISGGYEEKTYYDDHVIPLFNQVFNLNLKEKFFPSRNTYGFVIRDKKVLTVFKNLGFPSGSKSLTVNIPEIITSSKDTKIISSFLRGYFDTDGSLNFRNRKGGKTYSKFKQTYHYYPRIHLTTVSKQLYLELAKLLQKFKLRYYTQETVVNKDNWNNSYRILLVGEKNLLGWISQISIKNSTKLSRYLIWKKHGFCPTNITFNQRINILEGRLNPHSLYGPVV